MNIKDVANVLLDYEYVFNEPSFIGTSRFYKKKLSEEAINKLVDLGFLISIEEDSTELYGTAKTYTNLCDKYCSVEK